MYLILQLKHRERVLGLILVSPLCRAPSWTEWFYNKVSFYIFCLPLCCEKKFCSMKEEIIVNTGHVKFNILLRDVWCSERVSAAPLLQQGTLHAFPSLFTWKFWHVSFFPLPIGLNKVISIVIRKFVDLQMFQNQI